MQLTYFGQSAFELEGSDGTRLLVDPWIADNPHCDRTVDSFDDVTAVLVTHAAFDHLGDAPEIARRNGSKLVCDHATRTALANRGFPEDLLIGYIWGAEHTGEGWSAKIVEAHHLSFDVEAEIIGPALAYIVTMDDTAVYHMGDTSIFGDIELFGQLYDPTVSLIPVGRAPGYYTELHPDEASLVAEWVDPEIVIPMHYQPGSENPETFRRHCEDRGVLDTTDVELLPPGSSLEL